MRKADSLAGGAPKDYTRQPLALRPSATMRAVVIACLDADGGLVWTSS